MMWFQGLSSLLTSSCQQMLTTALHVKASLSSVLSCARVCLVSLHVFICFGINSYWHDEVSRTEHSYTSHACNLCIHAYIATYMHTCIYARMHTRIHAYSIRAYTQACIHVCMHTCVHACAHVTCILYAYVKYASRYHPVHVCWIHNICLTHVYFTTNYVMYVSHNTVYTRWKQRRALVVRYIVFASRCVCASVRANVVYVCVYMYVYIYI